MQSVSNIFLPLNVFPLVHTVATAIRVQTFMQNRASGKAWIFLLKTGDGGDFKVIERVQFHFLSSIRFSILILRLLVHYFIAAVPVEDLLKNNQLTMP